VLYSHTAELAIRAALFLALQPPGKLSPVREIARSTRLPEPYLAKILQRLSAAALVRAFRGPGGGLELGRDPKAINLWSIVCAVEDCEKRNLCVLGLQTCSGAHPCSLHHRWEPLKDEMRRLLEESTLAELAEELRGERSAQKQDWPPLPAASRSGAHSRRVQGSGPARRRKRRS
jgi:Rrf2 family transcriptional regulator, iron-sulfur cluster assembly transcription factor